MALGKEALWKLAPAGGVVFNEGDIWISCQMQINNCQSFRRDINCIIYIHFYITPGGSCWP